MSSNVFICCDRKDNYPLSLAKDRKADFLGTGSQDLLILGKIWINVNLHFETISGDMVNILDWIPEI